MLDKCLLLLRNPNYHRWFAFIGIIVFALILRGFALGQIYHQDEYKWAQIVDPAYGLQGTIPHPPLGEFLYHHWGSWFGFGALRGLPFLITIVNFALLGVLILRERSEKHLLITYALLGCSLAGVIASVQIDIDGAILIFWTLLAWLGARIWLDEGCSHGVWILLAACVGGMLSKLSFILVPTALAIPWLFSFRKHVTKKTLGIGAIVVIVGMAALLLPAVQELGFIQYAKSISVGGLHSRSWSQLLLHNTKVLVMLGPAVLLFIYGCVTQPRRYVREIWYSVVQVTFYDILFDFTHRAIDRYLLVLCIPVVLVAADVLTQWMKHLDDRKRFLRIIPLVPLVLTAVVCMLPKALVPLHPKAAFLARVTSGDLRFLIPITGGSGPIGFFIPADVVFAMFAMLFIVIVVGIYRPFMRRCMSYTAMVIILVYGVVFSLEYSRGIFYGSASQVAKSALRYIQENGDIQNVITYNDIGGWELGEMGKYFKRFYMNPEFAETNERKFSQYNGHYLVVSMPPLNPASKQARYFTECEQVYQNRSKRVMSQVYDCRGIPYETMK